MKEKPILFSSPMVNAIIANEKTQTRRINNAEKPNRSVSTGDVLWVRETWKQNNGIYSYAADYPDDLRDKLKPWKPSIFMPKKACRIFLEVKSVRVESLHSISESDAKNEGITSQVVNSVVTWGWGYNPKNYIYNTPIEAFKGLWKSINGATSWFMTTSVVVIEFRKISNK